MLPEELPAEYQTELQDWSIFRIMFWRKYGSDVTSSVNPTNLPALSKWSVCRDTTLCTLSQVFIGSVCGVWMYVLGVFWACQCQWNSHCQVRHNLVLSATSHLSLQRHLCIMCTLRSTLGPSRDVMPVHYSLKTTQWITIKLGINCILWNLSDRFNFGLYRYSTGCPTRYRTRHFFNNSNTNEDIITKFEADLPYCVRNVTSS